MNPDIEKRFTAHNVCVDQALAMAQIRQAAKELAYLIDSRCPQSRERSIAFTDLENVVFWANASIARQPPDPGIPSTSLEEALSMEREARETAEAAYESLRQLIVNGWQPGQPVPEALLPKPDDDHPF